MFDDVTEAGLMWLRALVADLARLDRDVDDSVRIDRIRALEEVKAACAAAQARDAADLDASQRQQQAAAGVSADERGRGVGAQVALARRESPHRGARHLGLAKALVHEMPHTLDALTAGRLSEWRATLLVRETAVLTRADRTAVDREVAGDEAALTALEQLGDRALAARARQVAYRLDPHSVVARAARAVTERCVTVRPAPDTMAWLTALLPARDAIATHTSLARAAEAARNAGDRRSRGQLMADCLVGSVAGAAPTADGASGPGAPGRRPGSEDVAVRLVMTDRTLLDGHPEPAHLEGYGAVPAAWARDLVADTLDPLGGGQGGGGDRAPRARVFVKRLLTDPVGAVSAMDSRARIAPTGLAAFVRTRDGGRCRTPWCDAPVRHTDHVTPHAEGGATTADALQGLCEACNHTKQLLGWRARVVGGADAHAVEPDGSTGADRPAIRHTVDTTTPTGRTYRSTAPLLPGVRPPPVAGPAAAGGSDSPVERWLEQQLDLAA